MNSGGGARYLLAQTGSGAIGYDGMGAIDRERSDANIVVLHRSDGSFEPVEMQIESKKLTATHLYMRRGTKPFDLLYEYDINALIVRAELVERQGFSLQGSIQELTPVTCHFGTFEGKYYFGNLRHYSCWGNLICWERSTFIEVSSDLFSMNFTHIERKQVPPTNEIKYERRGIGFSSGKDFIVAKRLKPLRWFIPEKLFLTSSSPGGIINIMPALTLVSEDISNFITDISRPKFRVPGMIFSPPQVEVFFDSSYKP
jgi:hypothetical protein